MDAFAAEMTTNLYGNPHSGSWPSQHSTNRVEDVRLQLLDFFNAKPTEYDIVFVANATAGVKLVVEGLRSHPRGYRLAYHQACHTSLIGAREEAVETVCLSDTEIDDWTRAPNRFTSPEDGTQTLFAYTAQSHLDGRRYPISWTKSAKQHQQPESSSVFTLLDCASLASTSPIDMSHPDFSADFVVMSLYKIFGFPDLGALFVRRSAEHVFDHRKYFGGGTVDVVVCAKENWHARKTAFLHERLEDGTLPFHSIIAAGCAIKSHRALFGSMDDVKAHTTHLTTRFYNALTNLRHGNNAPACHVYSSDPVTTPLGTGPILAFNLKDSSGAWVGLEEFEKLAALQKMHLRTGSACSPGGIMSMLSLEPWEIRNNFSAGFKCGMDSHMLNGKPAGVIRASLGAMSTEADVDRFMRFLEDMFVETHVPLPPTLSSLPLLSSSSSMKLQSIMVYPIKSCGSFTVPPNTPWSVRPEGLAWDREWCLIHRGSGQALSQKRYPKMALLQPTLDFTSGVLRVQFGYEEISVPLSADPSVFQTMDKQLSSRVCGDVIRTQVYADEHIHDFFSDALGVPCALARFPPGGLGHRSRTSKLPTKVCPIAASPTLLPGSFPSDIPSPPDSDSEQQQESRILLANESPILMIHTASIDALNRDIVAAGGEAVSAASFRANVIVSNSDDGAAWSEDEWREMRIGASRFSVLAPCRRCQMVCVDQDTGDRRQEPLTTLSKTRRRDGKVYFGMHMQRLAEKGEQQLPLIQIGDAVNVE